MNSNELHWLAGLLEADGTFSCRIGTPPTYKRYSVQVGMTDEDTVRRCQRTSGLGVVRGPYQAPGNRKPMWFWTVGVKNEARSLMELVLPIMGERRQRQIRSCLDGVPSTTFTQAEALAP